MSKIRNKLLLAGQKSQKRIQDSHDLLIVLVEHPLKIKNE